MKTTKRIILIFLILTTIGFLFRSWLYKHLITYKSVGQRKNYIAGNQTLINYIEINVKDKKDLDIKDIIAIGLSITSRKLNFTAAKNDNDPNKLINSQTAHCVGYAAFFSTTCNYLLKKYNLDNTWKAKPQIGQLYLLGKNVHRYFNSPFFKDHDFVVIENKKTKEIFAVDPTVNDYLFIDYITYKR